MKKTVTYCFTLFTDIEYDDESEDYKRVFGDIPIDEAIEEDRNLIEDDPLSFFDPSDYIIEMEVH